MFLGSAPPVSAIEVRLRDYVSWRAGDLVIASGVVEGAAWYVVGERLNKSTPVGK